MSAALFTAAPSAQIHDQCAGGDPKREHEANYKGLANTCISLGMTPSLELGAIFFQASLNAI
jgi:hypothetical protein